MLISEIKGWHYIITWDNPVPASSATMLSTLKKLGKISTIETKTTVALSPKASTNWRDIRNAITENLHEKKGNALYVNIMSGQSFQYGRKTNYKWDKVLGR